MGIFDRFLRKPKVETRSIDANGLFFGNSSSYNKEKALKLSAFYCGVNQISNSVGLLPIKIVEINGMEKKAIPHPLFKLLNTRPDGKHTHFNFMKMMVESVILRGNGYAIIERDDRTLLPKALHYINPDYVQPIVKEDGSVKYLVAGLQKAIDASDMIDVHMHIDENYNGISLLKYAALSLKGASDATEHAGTFFGSGANLAGVLKTQQQLTNDQKKQLIESWNMSIGANNGSKVPVSVLPSGVEYQPIGLAPSDSMIMDYFNWSVIEIARFLCIPPSKLMVMDDVSYNSLEFNQITYLQDTILPYTQAIEDEMNTKLFKPSQIGKIAIDFDYAALLDTDKKSQAQYYNSMVTLGILSINEVRSALGFNKIETSAGDAHWMQISYGSADDIADGKYIKQKSQDQNTKVDNKVVGAEKNE